MKTLASQPARFTFRLSAALVVACIAAPCALLSAPAWAASYDCSKGGSANEKLICNDPELSALDDKLGKTYKLARKKSANRHAFAVASDKQWQWREQNCHDRACLLDWYHQRQAALEAASTAELAGAGEDGKGAAAVPGTVAADAKPAAPKTEKMTATDKAEKSVVKTVKPLRDASATNQPAPPVAMAAVTAAAAMPAVVAPAVAPAMKPVAIAKPAATAKPAAATMPPAASPAKQTLQLNLTATQIAGIAPEGAAARGHFLSTNKGEYLYADPDGDSNVIISVHYLGIEHGQYIIEAKRKDVYTRYTCSADCSLIGELQLPGDVETDMVILKNDHRSLPSLIVTDAVNGLLLESVAVRN